MKKRNPYKTAQQEAMLQYFLEDKHNFLTVKDLLSSLQKLKSSRLMDRERSIGVCLVRRLI